MAQQESIIKLKGKIGDLTFYKTKDGYQARQATGVDPARIANDPNYQRTRENNAEFTAGAAAAKRLRDTLRPMILLTYDPKMPSRLFSRMMRVVKADTVNDRGQRRVLPEHVGLLSQFGFNAAAQLANTVFAAPAVTVDREAGTVQLELPSLAPAVVIAAPGGATHFQFNFGAALVDFDNPGAGNGSVMEAAATAVSDLKAPFVGETLSVTLPEASTLPLFILFGVSFYQEVNTKHYPLNNGAYNPISIIQIDVA